jgi:hypothetical protein
MKSFFRKIIRTAVAAGLSLLACVTTGAQEDSVGIVRITKPKSGSMMAPEVTTVAFHQGRRFQSTSAICDPSSNCQTGMDGNAGQCPTGWTGDGMGMECRPGWGHHGMWGHHFGCHYGCCHDHTGQAMCDYFRCKFGYFIPTGAGGAGVPCCGHYSRVYPQDPYYFDQRDGQTFAAQGYGSPIAVPLAPVVSHTFNYGWGIPSSRMTPISRPAY